MAEREDLGRLVRETWVKWAASQPDPKPSWLTGWDDLGAGQREVDMRIGEAVAVAEQARLFTAIRHAIGLDKPWRGEALDLILSVLTGGGDA